MGGYAVGGWRRAGLKLEAVGRLRLSDFEFGIKEFRDLRYSVLDNDLSFTNDYWILLWRTSNGAFHSEEKVGPGII